MLKLKKILVIRVLLWNVLPRNKYFHAVESLVRQSCPKRRLLVLGMAQLQSFSRLACVFVSTASRPGFVTIAATLRRDFRGDGSLLVTWIALTTWSVGGPTRQQGSNGARTYNTSREKPNLHRDCEIGMALRSLGSGPQLRVLLYMFHRD